MASTGAGQVFDEIKKLAEQSNDPDFAVERICDFDPI